MSGKNSFKGPKNGKQNIWVDAVFFNLNVCACVWIGCGCCERFDESTHPMNTIQIKFSLSSWNVFFCSLHLFCFKYSYFYCIYFWSLFNWKKKFCFFHSLPAYKCSVEQIFFFTEIRFYVSQCYSVYSFRFPYIVCIIRGCI